MKFFQTFTAQVKSLLPVTVFAAALFLLPQVSLAQSEWCARTPKDFAGLICLFLDLIATLVPVVFSLMLLVFFWGLAKMILHGGDETAQSEGKQLMIWGIIGLFVAVSVYGIVGFFYGSFNFSEGLQFPPLLPRW